MKVFLLNLAILAAVIVGIAVTANPLFVLALFFLRDMSEIDPQMLMRMQESSTDVVGRPIGFTADFEDPEDD